MEHVFPAVYVPANAQPAKVQIVINVSVVMQVTIFITANVYRVAHIIIMLSMTNTSFPMCVWLVI